MSYFSFMILLANVVAVLMLCYLILILSCKEKFHGWWMLFCVLLGLSILLQMEKIPYIYKTDRMLKFFSILSLNGFIYQTIKSVKNNTKI
jgi:hypothetical protein